MGQGTMRNSIPTALAALAVALVVSGCQSSSVDALETAALDQRAGDISADDLDAGKQRFREENYGLAEEHFRKAVEQRSDNAEAWMGLAAAYDQLGRFDFADRAYEQLLDIAGRQPRVLNNMGYSHYLRGDESLARALFLQARASMSDPSVVDANLALLDED